MSSKYKFHNPDGLYFVSFSVIGWMDVFIRPVYRHILLDSIRFSQIEKGLVVHAWIVMSSHVHLIISKTGDWKLEDILRDLKKFTSLKIIASIKENVKESRKEWMLKMFEEYGAANSNNTRYQFWQQDNHPVDLISNEMIEQRLNYLHNNPVEAEWVERPEEFLYSSARDYCGRKGLLNVVLIH